MDVEVLTLEQFEQGTLVILLRGSGSTVVELDDRRLVRADQLLIVLL